MEELKSLVQAIAEPSSLEGQALAARATKVSEQFCPETRETVSAVFRPTRQDIPTLTRDGYLITFEILKKVLKVICVGWWLLKKHPRSGIPLAVYPTLMLLWLGSRYKRRLWLLKKNGDGVSDTQGWLLHAEDSFEPWPEDSLCDLVNDYDSRNAIVGKFQKVLQDQRKSGIVIPWITIIATGFYIAAAGKLVTEGELSLGSFLATINLYKDLGDRFLGIFSDFEALSETDLPQRMAAHEEHEQYMFKFLSSPPAAPDVDVIYEPWPCSAGERQRAG
eukprot:g6612.t1